MKLILDGMGGDNAPDDVVKGAIEAARELKNDDIVIVGKKNLIEDSINLNKYVPANIDVYDAAEVIETGEPPVKAVRQKKESSIVKGLELVRDGKGDVFISAGNTGALLAGGLFILKRIEGIDRPSLCAIYPVIGMEPSLFTDCGANAECKPKNLLEFAIMGSIYMEKVLGRENPTVGLVNNGTEVGKGTALTKEAHEYISKSGVNFIGYIEARDIPNGACDVIVTDGFTGNSIIKLTEGMGIMFMREMKRRFTSTTKSKFGALLLKSQLSGIKKEFNYAEYGGAPILGVKGNLIKMHGSSDPLAVKQTILKATDYVNGKVTQIISESIGNIESISSQGK